MKRIILFLVLSIFCNLAIATESRIILLSKAQPTHQLTIEDREYKDIVEWYTYEATCKRQIIDSGQCHSGSGGMICSNDGSRCTGGITRTDCMVTEEYSCRKEDYRVIGKEYVRTHSHEVNISLDEKLLDQPKNFEIKVIAKLDKVSIKLISKYSKELLKMTKTTNDYNSSFLIFPTISKESADNFVNSSIEFTKLSLKKDNISFDIENVGDFIHMPLEITMQVDRNPKFSIARYDFERKYNLESIAKSVIGNNDLSLSMKCTYLNELKRKPCFKKRRYNLYFKLNFINSSSYLNKKDFAELFEKDILSQFFKVKPF